MLGGGVAEDSAVQYPNIYFQKEEQMSRIS